MFLRKVGNFFNTARRQSPSINLSEIFFNLNAYLTKEIQTSNYVLK
jgi:hypothetical protein